MKNLSNNHATGCVAHSSAFRYNLRSWGFAISFASSLIFILLSCKDQVQLTQEPTAAITLADEDLGAPKTQLFKQKISRQAESFGRLQLMQPQNNLQPTGFYVDTSSTITVHVRKISGEDLPKLVVGIPFSGTREYETWYQLKEGINVINTDTDMLSTGNNSPARELWGGNATIVFDSDLPGALGEVEVTFEAGFKKVPYYVRGVTSIADYQRMLDVFGDSVGNVLLVSDRTMFSLSMPNARQYRSSNVDSLLLICDQVIASQEAFSGMDSSLPEHQPRSNRILIIDGFQVNPTAYYLAISFPQGSMNEILVPSLLKKSWGLYHELGHTHQQSWTWGAVLEVTVNIYSGAALRAMGQPKSPLSDEVWSIVTNYFTKPASERNYNTDEQLDFFTRLVMFDQLWLAYGDSFYQNLHKKCRVDKPIFNSDDDKIAYFMTAACDIAGEDLTDFFRKWGLPASEATYAAIANKNLPQPSRDYTTLRD
jgi:hypothetical protein